VSLAGCAGARTIDGVFHAPQERYQVRPPGAPWVPASLDPDRLAFRAAGLNAAMALWEDCTSPEPGELRWVAHHLFFGLKDRQTLEREAVRVGHHPAVRTRLTGRLEDQPVALEAVTLRHAGCLYDLVYVAPPGRFDAGLPAFEAFVQSFTPRP
jgi:hypothetical protein